MVVYIALTILIMFLSQKEVNCSKKLKMAKKISSISTNKTPKKEYTFFEDVYAIVRLIPKGRVTNYGAIGKYLGTALSARMVGWAMNGAHSVQPKVPAHRVVNRNGMLTGKMHFATPTLMQELLEKEGIKVIKDQIQDFDTHFWDPMKEMI
jgi:methylated-DNA-protein-cysteine methyltransferase-like protein